MSEIYEPEKQSIKLAQKLREGNYKKIVLVSWHGAGDQCMIRAPLTKLKEMFPDITIDIAVCKGLDQKAIIPEAIEVEGNWREVLPKDYDLVVQVNMPLEKLDNLNMTKAEICCVEELGIPPACGHLPVKRKKLVGVHFHNTSVSWLTNPDEKTAKKIWDEIIEANCIPVETLFQHVFYNDTSKKFDFVDNHVRNWPARLDTLISLLGCCDYFIGVVSGNWHLALAILPPERVLFLEKQLKLECFTRLPIARVSIKDGEYQEGRIKEWIQNIVIS